MEDELTRVKGRQLVRTQCIHRGKVLVIVSLSILGCVFGEIDSAEHTGQRFT